MTECDVSLILSYPVVYLILLYDWIGLQGKHGEHKFGLYLGQLEAYLYQNYTHLDVKGINKLITLQDVNFL